MLYADTLTVDPTVDSAQLAGLINDKLTFGMGMVSGNQPFQKLSATTFRTAMGAQSTGISSVARTDGTGGSNYLQISKSFAAPGNRTQQQTFSFDPDLGAVTRVQTTMDAPEARQSGSVNITYTDVSNMPNVLLPTRLSSTQSVLVKYNNQTMSVTQDLAYSNVQINTLPDSYFSVGGN